jgi:NADPH:quinone reductase-like Zn-dependent oxidoreductase
MSATYRAVMLTGKGGPEAGRVRLLGAPTRLAQLALFANIFTGARLRGRRGRFYGITMLYRNDPQPLREDLPAIFSLLAEKKIGPLVNRTFPLLDARKALERLARGSIEGKIVLLMTDSGRLHYASQRQLEVVPPARRLSAGTLRCARVTAVKIVC